MILSFPIWGNEMIYTLLFIMFFVYFADLYKNYVGVFNN